ncbi:MAG TPA: hypothetical protein PK760_04055, partial [Flavobacteriales bacterium]|nr:hypothetical protein [Flavobacteriales bacterium]
YCFDLVKRDHFDYMVFGHRHLPVDMEIAPSSRYVNLGDWISYFTYATFEGSELKLMKRMSDGPLSEDVRIAGAPARSTQSPVSELGGMTVNERLFHMGLFEEFDLAISRQDVARLQEILALLEIGQENTNAIITRVLPMLGTDK